MNEDRAYFILELKKGANSAQIKTAYKRLIKQYHPDNFYNDPQKRKFAEEKTREIIEAYKYLINKQNNYESSKSDSSEHNSSKDKNEDKTYDHSKSNTGSYNSKNDNTYSQQTATRYGYSLYNGKSIFSFISGILSVFFTIISYLVFQIPITESVATQIIAIIVFFIISPIIVISYFIGRKHGNDHRKAAVYTFILSFFLFGLVPVLKLIVVSIILLPFPVLSIIYGIRGLVNFKYTNSGLWTGVIGLNMGTLSFIFFILHFAVGLTL